MTGPFFGDWAVSSSSWAAFERLVLRLIYAKGYQHASVVGQTGDGGADVLAIAKGKRWLFQVKAFNKPVGPDVVTETLSAVQKYDADVPVIVSKNGFTAEVFSIQSKLLSEGIRLQLWDMDALRRQGSLLPTTPPILPRIESGAIREYQRQAIDAIVSSRIDRPHGSALVVLATGLGKTFVAAESMRRMRAVAE